MNMTLRYYVLVTVAIAGTYTHLLACLQYYVVFHFNYIFSLPFKTQKCQKDDIKMQTNFQMLVNGFYKSYY